jgi:hypothetical protein
MVGATGAAGGAAGASAAAGAAAGAAASAANKVPVPRSKQLANIANIGLRIIIDPLASSFVKLPDNPSRRSCAAPHRKLRLLGHKRNPVEYVPGYVKLLTRLRA